MTPRIRPAIWILSTIAILYAGFRWFPLSTIDPLTPDSLTTVTDADNKVLGRFSRSEIRMGTPLTFSDIPVIYRNLLLYTEDRYFYLHPGINPLAMARAFWTNVRAHRLVSGGSTITQQLARTYLNDNERTLARKLKEMLIAVALECRYTKPEILTLYINRIYYGHQIRGLSEAARFYFSKPASALSGAEAALLITITNAPSYYDPIQHPEQVWAEARERLKRYATSHPHDREAALGLTAKPRIQLTHGQVSAPHFIRYVLHQYPDQPRIQTTLDSTLQTTTETIIREELDKLGRFHVTNAAVLVVDMHTGAVLAYAGSQDFNGRNGQIDGIQMRRQPGSALKPLVYGLALDQGFNPASILPDIPLRFEAGTGVFSPNNYSGKFRGPVRLRTALANSLNIPALWLTQSLGIEPVYNYLIRCGLSFPRPADTYGVGLVLGNAETTMWDLTQAYTLFGHAGAPIRLRMTPAAPAEVQAQRATPNAQVLSPEAAFIITDILSDAAARNLAFGLNSVLNLPFPAAVKTGTSTGFRDNWCIGYTPDRLVAVWVGNFDNSEMANISGITGAGPIWHRVLCAAQPAVLHRFTPPAALTQRTLCSATGLIAARQCRDHIVEWQRAIQPPKNCSHDAHQELKNATRFAAPAHTPKPKALAITYPLNNTWFALDPRINPARQAISLKTSAMPGIRHINWSVDGRPISGTRWVLEKGTHTFTVQGERDGRLITDSVTIRVW